VTAPAKQFSLILLCAFQIKFPAPTASERMVSSVIVEPDMHLQVGASGAPLAATTKQ
jgi:hypothetical protein